MSEANHPNLHAAGLIVDLYHAVDQRVRGDALAHKQMIMASPRLKKMLLNFVGKLEEDIDQLIVTLKNSSICILDCDSPSYPPTDDEYRQCGCPLCLQELASRERDK